MGLWASWKYKARALKQETYAICLACRDPRVPWYGRALAVCVVGYAFSPIDLIPDFIPVLGYLDDLILIPLGIALVMKTIPPEVMAESRERARVFMSEGKPRNWVAAAVIVVVWVVLTSLGIVLIVRVFSG